MTKRDAVMTLVGNVAATPPWQARARKRDELLAATEHDLSVIAERVDRGTLAGAGRIGVTVGKVIGKYKVGKHFRRHITDTGLTYHRDQSAIDTEAVRGRGG